MTNITPTLTADAEAHFTRIRRGRGSLPWGFQPDPDDPSYLLPELDKLAVLEVAFRYIAKGRSYRDARSFVKKRTGSSISLTRLRSRYLSWSAAQAQSKASKIHAIAEFTSANN